MPPHGSHARALVIEPRAERAAELAAALRELGAEVELAASAEDAWRDFPRCRPTHVFAAVGGRRDGAWLLRRLQGEFLGTLPAIYLLGDRESAAAAAGLEPDALLLYPIARAALGALIAGAATAGDGPARQATRLRELSDVSLLGADLIDAFDAAVARVSLAFHTEACLAWGADSRPYWPRSSRQLAGDEPGAILDRCRAALAFGATTLVAAGPAGGGVTDAPVQSLLAAPLGDDRAPSFGLCLVADGPRRFSQDERDALRVLCRRLSGELAWMSAHHRLVVEHEKLRQAALLDPLLGVWTRAALEQAIEVQLAAAPALAVALFDVHELRAINERHGHAIGDAVLAHFARTVSDSVRAEDQVGRVGGDELAVLFSGADLEAARRRAEHVLESLAARPFRAGGLEIAVRVHAGVALLGPDEGGGGTVFGRARAAMRRARRTRVAVATADPSRDRAGAERDTEAPPLPAGKALGGMYRILHEISRGAMGVVYRGEDLGLGRQVALKVLRPDLASDSQLVAQFRAEAALLASLRHKNLVQVYSFGSDGSDVYFVMELVEGEPLSTIAARLARSGERLDLAFLAKIVEEIADALDAMHALGIVHRDVKPDNVLVDRVGDRAVLVDVGIARRPGEDRDAAGTPGFAAPECFMAADESAATDVYGLAATAYAMLCGRPPYSGDGPAEVVERQLEGPPEPPSVLRPELGAGVDAVFSAALAAEPSRRYRSASALAVALSAALEHARERAPVRRSKQPTTPVPRR